MGTAVVVQLDIYLQCGSHICFGYITVWQIVDARDLISDLYIGIFFPCIHLNKFTYMAYVWHLIGILFRWYIYGNRM